MDSKYIITVTGIQDVDGEKDKIEVVTIGDYVTKNGHRYIKYREFDNDDPKLFTDTVVKVEGDSKVSVIRLGDHPSRLILEKDRRHQCHYRTAMGEIMMGVYTSKIKHSLDDHGGELSLKYQLDFFCDLVSTNELRINIKEKEV